MENRTSESRQRFWQSDRLFIGSIFIIYCLCATSLIGLTVWGLNRRENALAGFATSTANAIFTQQANATATTIAHATQLSQYKLVDRFDSNVNEWRVGGEDTSYWKGKIQISSGVYSWDVQDAKDGFVAWAYVPEEYDIRNYDTYVDIKFEKATGKACGGFLYHLSADGWEKGGYTFYICHTGFYYIYYHRGTNWSELKTNNSTLIFPSDWNRLEMLIRGSHHIFLINNQIVFETDDDRRTTGWLALFINVDEAETKILFDNFGFQPR